jgi:hypothetical protein
MPGIPLLQVSFRWGWTSKDELYRRRRIEEEEERRRRDIHAHRICLF